MRTDSRMRQAIARIGAILAHRLCHLDHGAGSGLDRHDVEIEIETPRDIDADLARREPLETVAVDLDDQLTAVTVPCLGQRLGGMHNIALAAINHLRPSAMADF